MLEATAGPPAAHPPAPVGKHSTTTSSFSVLQAATRAAINKQCRRRLIIIIIIVVVLVLLVWYTLVYQCHWALLRREAKILMF
jgi:hypothetical protein